MLAEVNEKGTLLQIVEKRKAKLFGYKKNYKIFLKGRFWGREFPRISYLESMVNGMNCNSYMSEDDGTG